MPVTENKEKVNSSQFTCRQKLNIH